MQVFSTTHHPTGYGFTHPTSVGRGIVQLPFTPIEFSISPDGKTWASEFDQADLVGVYCYKAPDVAPATQTDTYQKIGINDGQQLISSSYEQRQITMNVHLGNALNESDALLAFDSLQAYLVSRDAYWICFSNWPQRMYYVKAKPAAPTFTGNAWISTVTLTDQIGLSRSVGTTLSSDRVIGFGNNEPIDKPSYTFGGGSFTVQNLSAVDIDPIRRGHPLTITCDGSTSGDMTIKNATNNTSITRKGGWSGKWVLDGVNPELNGNADGINTDHGAITLKMGANQFEVSGFSGQISFDFPMWWLS